MDKWCTDPWMVDFLLGFHVGKCTVRPMDPYAYLGKLQ